MTKFEGFGPKVYTWFKALEADNSREYFAANRDFFEESIRDQMGALLTELNKKFGGESRSSARTGTFASRPTSRPTIRARHQPHRRLQFVTSTWRAAAPVTGWLDEHVGASTAPMDRGQRRR
jgi:uncharacterized protein (DUF2461 family)